MRAWASPVPCAATEQSTKHCTRSKMQAGRYRRRLAHLERGGAILAAVCVSSSCSIPGASGRCPANDSHHAEAEQTGAVSTGPRGIAAVSGGPGIGAGAVPGSPRRSAGRLGAPARSRAPRAARQRQDGVARLAAAGSHFVPRGRCAPPYAGGGSHRDEARRTPAAGILAAATHAKGGLCSWDHLAPGPGRFSAPGRSAGRARANESIGAAARRGAYPGCGGRLRPAQRRSTSGKKAAFPAGAGGYAESAFPLEIR